MKSQPYVDSGRGVITSCKPPTVISPSSPFTPTATSICAHPSRSSDPAYVKSRTLFVEHQPSWYVQKFPVVSYMVYPFGPRPCTSLKVDTPLCASIFDTDRSSLQSANAGLPTGWEVRHSNSKNLPYYFNPEVKESRWEPPPGTDTEALKAYMASHHSSAPIRSPAAAKDSNKIRAAHLLIKHKDSRRPSSWRENEITRTKDEAVSTLLGHEARIRSGQTSLGELAVTESDCSSARKRGDLCVQMRGLVALVTSC